MARSPRAALSPAELNLLRRLLSEQANDVPQERRKLFASMGLIRQTKAGRLKLTDRGRQRLEGKTLE